jgi:DNA invertase Pin-like site-specific DNA recombinase
LPERPAAYVRVVGARNARDPHVRDQLQAVLAAARQRGWPQPAVYTEIGLPGWHRPGSVLGRLAGYLASGRHDAIIVRDLSRISRDPADVLAFTVHCGRSNVTLEAVEEGRVDEPRIAALYARHRVIIRSEGTRPAAAGR